MLRRSTTGASRPSGLVLEGERHTRAIGHDLAVFHLQVELVDFSDAQVAQRFGSNLNRAARRIFPRCRARPDNVGYPIDRMFGCCLRSHAVLLASETPQPRWASLRFPP